MWTDLYISANFRKVGASYVNKFKCVLDNIINVSRNDSDIEVILTIRRR